MGVYLLPTKSLPTNVCSIVNNSSAMVAGFHFFLLFIMGNNWGRRFLARMYRLLAFLSKIWMYSMVGWTHSAMLLGNVHGVVVHATKFTPSIPTTGKLTTTAGSRTSL